jgi:hypothetical protein
MDSQRKSIVANQRVSTLVCNKSRKKAINFLYIKEGWMSTILPKSLQYIAKAAKPHRQRIKKYN